MNLIERLQKRLILFKIKDYHNIDGFLATFEAIELYRIASRLPPGSTIVEIGSWKGKSTYCLARGLRSGKVIAIDPFDASGDEKSNELYQKLKGERALIDQFRERMAKLNVLEKIEIFQGLSSQFVGKVEKIDFLFIDGDHSIENCEFDFTKYSPFIPSGGYLALHDYDPSRKNLGPTWVVDNIVISSGHYKFVDIVDSLWVGKKI